MPLTREVQTGTDFEGNKSPTFECQEFFVLVETLNKESVVGEHQCPVLAGLGCILIVIMFVSQIMPLFEGHSANKAGSTDIHLFVYLGLGFGNVLVDKLVCKLQTHSFSLQLDHFKICCKKR